VRERNCDSRFTQEDSHSRCRVNGPGPTVVGAANYHGAEADLLTQDLLTHTTNHWGAPQ